MSIAYKVLFIIAQIVVSLFMAVLATNICYAIYRSCEGSSAGLAFSLTFGVVPVAAILIFTCGFIARRIAIAKFSAGNAKRIYITVSFMFMAFLCITSALIAMQYPYSGEMNNGHCPKWLMSNPEFGEFRFEPKLFN